MGRIVTARLFSRVSSDGQARGNRWPASSPSCGRGLPADEVVVGPEHSYVDEGYSGATLARPALERLRDAPHRALRAPAVPGSRRCSPRPRRCVRPDHPHLMGRGRARLRASWLATVFARLPVARDPRIQRCHDPTSCSTLGLGSSISSHGECGPWVIGSQGRRRGIGTRRSYAWPGR